MERTVAGSNTTRSAIAPSRITPRSRSPSRAAGAEVILRIASSRLSSASSRTNWPRMRGKLPYVRGLGLSPRNVLSVPTIPTGCATNERQRRRRRPARDLADAQVLGEQEVAHDVERVVTRLGHDVGDRPALPAQVLRPAEGAQADVGPAGPAGVRRAARCELGPHPVARGAVGEPLLERSRAAGLDPLRQLDEQAGRGPFGRIGVERDVEALGAGVVDEREQRLRAAGVRLAVIEVGDVGGRRRTPADVDRLADRVEVAVAQRIADVGVVEAAVPAGLLGERRQLGGRGVAPGRVVEPGAEPERAVGHRVAEHARASGRAPARRPGRRPSRAPRSGAASCRRAWRC